MITNKLTLAFPRPEESVYQDHFFRVSLKAFRLAYISVIVLYGLFGFLDRTLVPEHAPVFFLIRFVIVIPFLLIVFTLSFTRFFRKIWQWLLFASFLVGGGGIEAMLVIAPLNYTYYAGLMLIFSAGYFFIKLRFHLATVAGWTLVLLFNVFTFRMTQLSADLIISFNFFFISANLISMLAAYSIEYFDRKNWYLTKQLDRKQNELEEYNRNLEHLVQTRTHELSKAKEQAEESDRLKSAFLANMSHEIRTPMNGILGFADLLKEPGLSGDEQQKYIRIIEKSGERMLNIIRDIIDISKIEAGETKVIITETNIDELMDFVYAFFKPEAEVKGLLLSKAGKNHGYVGCIMTDREKLYAILANLIKNALKFCQEGSIEFGYRSKNNFIEFFVSDTGPGISPDKQEHIFERFAQADYTNKQASQGAGLGLSISKGFVTLLGGRIWLESEPNKGSTFYFTIPVNLCN